MITRLEAIARVTNLVRKNLEKNGMVYRSGMVPNLQSIIDLAQLPDEMINFERLEEQIAEAERLIK